MTLCDDRLKPEPLSTRHVLREMARAYRERWVFLIGAGLLIFAPVSLLEALDSTLGDVDTDELDLLPAVGISALIAAESISTLLATVLYAGVGVAAVTASRDREAPSLPRLAHSLSYSRLIAADLLLAVVVAAGLLALVVPGLILLVWFALVGPVIEVERRPVTEGFRRSRVLVRMHFWRVAVLVIPTFFAEELIVSATSSAFGSALGHAFLSEWAGGLVGNLVAAPVLALAVGVLFYELRDRQQPPAEAGRLPREVLGD